MLDFGHTIDQDGRFQSFSHSNGGTTDFQWFEWIKPRGVSMCMFTALGSGGAGAAGTLSVVDTNVGSGGGGGGSGGQSIVMLPAYCVPDVLYIRCPRGGVPSVTGPGVTAVSLAPDTTANNCLLVANAGGNGSGTSAGTGGSIATAATMLRGTGLGAYKLLAGQAGGAGSTTGGAGTGVSLPTTGLIVTGGAGGGGSNLTVNNPNDGGAGGDVGGPFGLNQTAYFFGGAYAVVVSASVPGNAGSSGGRFMPGLLLFAGGGGGSGCGCYGNAVVAVGDNGGAGGRGAFGCGGGGGGASATGFTAGAGGNGGPGLVIVQCW